MALTGIQIYKLLPKTNCKKCGLPTCLAFAMKLAGKQASLDQCPDVSDESKAALSEASEPPIKLVQVGAADDTKVEVGNETVMFRHEESFYHQTGVAIRVTDDLSADDMKALGREHDQRSQRQVNLRCVQLTNRDCCPADSLSLGETDREKGELDLYLGRGWHLCRDLCLGH